MLSEMHHGCVRCSKFIAQILGEISCLKCCTYPCQVKLRQTFEYFQAWALEGALGGTKALWIFKITAKNVFFLVSREKKQISPLTAPPSVPLEKILPTPMLPENHIVYRYMKPSAMEVIAVVLYADLKAPSKRLPERVLYVSQDF